MSLFDRFHLNMLVLGTMLNTFFWQNNRFIMWLMRH